MLVAAAPVAGLKCAFQKISPHVSSAQHEQKRSNLVAIPISVNTLALRTLVNFNDKFDGDS